MVAGEQAVRGRRSVGSLSPRLGSWLPPLLVIVGFLALYELVARANTSVLPEVDFPPPTKVVSALWDLVRTAQFWESLWITVKAWAGGLLAATILAVPLGMAIGASAWLWRCLRLLIEVLRPLPAVAIMPLLLLLLGSNLEMQIIFVLIIAFWPLLVQAAYGTQAIDPTVRDMALVYRLRWHDRIRFISLPSALPFLATGMRLAAVFALGGAVAVSLISSTSGGIGAEIALARTYARNDVMYAYVWTAGILGLLVNVAFRRLERRMLVWHASERVEAR